MLDTSNLLEYTEQEDNDSPVIEMTITKEKADIGESVTVNAYASDDTGVTDFHVYMDDKEMLNHTGRFSFTAAKEGLVTIKAVAKDRTGKTAEAIKTIQVVDRRDKTAPEAKILSPTTGTDIGFNVQIIGTVKDETAFDEYTLSYRAASDSEYTTFASGAEAIENGVLGEIDLSDFSAGTYEILLCAKDKAGNVSYTGIQIVIEKKTEQQEKHLYASIDKVELTQDQSKIEIYGTIVSDGNVEEYTVSYGKTGDEEKQEIARGNETVSNQLIATIDTAELTAGDYELIFNVIDEYENHVFANASFAYTKESIQLETDTQAPEVSFTQAKLTEEKDYIHIYGTAKDNEKLESYTVGYSKVGEKDSTPIGSGTETVEDELIGTIPTEGLESGDYLVILSARDTTGNIATATMIVTYTKGVTGTFGGETDQDSELGTQIIDGSVSKTSSIKLILSKNQASAGEDVQVKVSLSSDLQGKNVILAMDGEPLELEDYKTTITCDKAKKVELTASVLLDNGETMTATTYCQFYKANDKNPPVAAFDSPEGDTVINGLTEIIGSAYDEEELLYYTLEYRMAGDSDFQEIVRSTEPKKNDVLGTIDTTTLLNGVYEVCVSAVDAGGKCVL